MLHGGLGKLLADVERRQHSLRFLVEHQQRWTDPAAYLSICLFLFLFGHGQLSAPVFVVRVGMYIRVETYINSVLI